ncbi:phage tail tube protein [Bdellovibrio bacteriovorus]|uniref:phage tail tube protein n=1 Tax=Bdellovibrio bacteriovorus TaxID=959 RepID=UPI0035A622A6
MKALSNKSSVLAIVEEAQEGVPVKPTSADQYMALQDGFALTPQFETLENRELRDSIGRAKQILGRENPTASTDHYFRNSGIEGQKPDFALLLKSAMGEETVFAAEKVTVAGSTVAKLKLANGETVGCKRGQFLLIKDGANGYKVRPVLSVNAVTHELDLGFAVPVAPAAGVNLGKNILYEPKNEDHPTLSLWLYRANGGGVELITGARVVEISTDYTAGQLINASFSLAGNGYYFNPIEIALAKRWLDFEDAGGARSVQVPARMYKEPEDCAEAIQAAMNASGSADVFEVEYSHNTGKFTFRSNGVTFKLLWASGANAADSIGAAIGAGAADQTAALEYELANAIELKSPFTPDLDDTDPLAAKDNEVLLGDVNGHVAFNASRVNMSISLTKSDLPDVSAESGNAGSLFTAREVRYTISAYMKKYDASQFRRYHKGMKTGLMYTAGKKNGGNWVPGTVISSYVPSGTITSYSFTDEEGIAKLELELTAYVENAGEGEIFIGLL